jgi:hypothetical protein
MVGFAVHLGMNEQEPDEKTALVLGLVVFAIIGMSLIGGVLGIAGLFQRDKRPLFSILGLVLNGAILLGVGALIAIGLAAS